MFTVIVVLLLLGISVGGVYLLLKSMGRDGIEAAAPGSCKSGRCGVQPRSPDEAGSQAVPERYVRIEEIRRKDAPSNDPMQ